MLAKLSRENPPSPFGDAHMTLKHVRPATLNSTQLFVFLLIAVAIVTVAYQGSRQARVNR